MRVIIAGSRTIDSMAELERAIAESGFLITQVVSGGARGVDTLADRWSLKHQIPFYRIPARWNENGRKAGPIRNAQMARYAHDCPDGGGLIALWDGMTKGTKNMIGQAKKYLLKIHIHLVNSDENTWRKDWEYEE